MLQSKKNKITLSILDKLKQKGAPQPEGIQPFHPMGDVPAEDNGLSGAPEQSAPASNLSDEELLSERDRRKKRRKAEGADISSDEDSY